jgi:hypothetical protein
MNSRINITLFGSCCQIGKGTTMTWEARGIVIRSYTSELLKRFARRKEKNENQGLHTSRRVAISYVSHLFCWQESHTDGLPAVPIQLFSDLTIVLIIPIFFLIIDNARMASIHRSSRRGIKRKERGINGRLVGIINYDD